MPGESRTAGAPGGPTLAHVIAANARRRPDAPAIVDGGACRTYGDLLDRATRLGHGLRSIGVSRGESVIVILNNRLEYVEIDLALSLAGMVRVALNARWTLEEFSYAIADSDAKAIISEASFDEIADELTSRHEVPWIRLGGGPPRRGVAYEHLIEGASTGRLATMPGAGDLAWISYTAGTTGRSKGVELSHFALAQVATNIAVELGPVDADASVLLPQPLSHGAGYFALSYLAGGGAVHIMPKWDPEHAVSLGRTERIGTIKLVPAMLTDLLETRSDSPFGGIVYGAAPLPTHRLEEAVARFGPVLVQIYGQSEAPMTITVLDRADHAVAGEHRASAGRAFRTVRVDVVDDEGTPVPEGTIGELVVSGLHLMDGYRGMPEETARVLRDGWLRTRDMAFADERGYMYLRGRSDEMINSGGYNISPREVEDVISQHPAVQECAVVAMDHERLGQAVRAVVVQRPGTDVTDVELTDFCEKSLGFKRPRSVVFLDALPRNPYGKIDRPGLLSAVELGVSVETVES